MRRKLLNRFLASESEEELAKIVTNLSAKNRYYYNEWLARFHRSHGKFPQITQTIFTNENGVKMIIKGIH